MPDNTIVLNTEGPETRVAVLEDGQLAEYFMERKRERGIVGNIYQGKITRVLPGLQAAFVDLGPAVERAAFLYVGEILGADGGGGFADDEDDGKPRRRKRPPKQKIEDLVKPNQKQLVQIVKDPIGLKGARVTGYISLPGRYGVLMPAVDHVGVSRRIGTDKERKRLRDVVNEVRPKGMGFIVRTAAEGAEDQEIRDDVLFLSRLWTEISERKGKQKKGLVYADLDLVLRSIRDLLRPDTKEVVIDSEQQYERARKFVGAFLPRYVERIKHYQGRRPIFDHYNIEPALRTALGRKVPLKSGGHLVIDQGEALTAIDVNTGSFVGKDDLEKTVTANNLEACTEIARQLRLRNIGGIIVLDFVDMEKSENRKQVWEAFNKALSPDRSRCNVTRLSELGLIEMTRKRTRESLNQLLNEVCHTCDGRGSIKSTTTVANEILREVRRLGAAVEATTITVECSPAVAELINTYEREFIDELEKKFHKMVVIKATTELRPQEYKVAGKSSIIEEPKKGRRGKRGNGKSSRGGRSKAKKDGAKKDSKAAPKKSAAKKAPPKKDAAKKADSKAKKPAGSAKRGKRGKKTTTKAAPAAK